MQLHCRDHVLPLERVAIMGVLNVTPDSFSDGGQWLEPKRAVDHAHEMVAQGADIIDVGGESTRPGAAAVEVEEELRRVIPVIEELAPLDVPISIDTRKAGVARAAVAAGASIVNDTLGEETDRELDSIAADSRAAMVVMHSRGTPQTMRSLTEYDDLITDVKAFLARRVEELRSAGVAHESIVIDPGFGFAKDPSQNLELLNDLDALTGLDVPLLAGTSRKSFIGEVLDLPVDERIEGTIATTVWAVMKGARIVRVHDVEPVARAVRMTEAIMGGMR